jgi:hypothetical protein
MASADMNKRLRLASRILQLSVPDRREELEVIRRNHGNVVSDSVITCVLTLSGEKPTSIKRSDPIPVTGRRKRAPNTARRFVSHIKTP